MRKMFRAVVLAAFLCLSPVNARGQTLLVPGGQAIGLQLRDDTVTVAAYDESCTAGREAGLKIGDQIESVNGISVTTGQDVVAALTGAEGAATVTVRRDGRQRQLTIPLEAGRLGVYLRQGISGIGTVTFSDPATGTFAALGHGVSTPRGTLLEMVSGSACQVVLQDIKRGRPGDPGQLRGKAEADQLLGILTRNTPQGVFGRLEGGLPGTPLPVAAYSDLHTGDAAIRCTLDDTGVQEYSVEILKIYPENRSTSRNLLLKVTDEALLQKTGGVIQGMSGSPILQDGKLIGAVTHVLVNDPTTGYGIFIENMLDAASCA